MFFYRKIRLYLIFFFFSSRRRHTISKRDWSSDVCSSDLEEHADRGGEQHRGDADHERDAPAVDHAREEIAPDLVGAEQVPGRPAGHPDGRGHPPLEAHEAPKRPPRRRGLVGGRDRRRFERRHPSYRAPFERRLCRRNSSWGEVSEGGRSPPPKITRSPGCADR